MTFNIVKRQLLRALANLTGAISSSANITTTGDVSGADVTASGDLDAAGGFRRLVGPAVVTLAADQTDTEVPLGGAGVTWVAPRAGSITAFTGNIAAAITGSGTSVTVEVAVNGTPVAATALSFTEAGAETEDTYTTAKDTAGLTFAAGDNISVVYSSTTITNTPVLGCFIEVEC